MFDLLELNGTNERGIALQTKLGNDIANMIGIELSHQHYERYELLFKKHGSRWEPRKPPNGEYNCAGHVWASRRTCIYSEDEWTKIFVEDGYRKTNNPHADDLVVYSDARVGILHVGRVVDLRPMVHGSSNLTPWIVSKWSDFTGEVYHWQDDHPYKSDYDVTVEFWTDRPKVRTAER